MNDYGSDEPQVDAPSGTDDLGSRRRLVAVIAVVALLAALVVVVALVRQGDDHADTATGPTTTTRSDTTTTRRASTTTQAPTTSAQVTTTGPTAADDLAAFFTAAATLDQQLHAAAAAINAAGPPWTTISQDLAATVNAAELRPVLEAIPAGLPPELLRPVMLVTSDLASRRAAMTTFSYAGPAPAGDLLVELVNGHAAAERFDADLSDTRAAAHAHPPVAVAAPGSRAAAELQLLITYATAANAGCDGRGGVVLTQLPTIAWQSDAHGTISYRGTTITFDATHQADGTWRTQINAC